MSKGLVKIDNVKSLAAFLQKPVIKMAEALTGILASNKSELVLSTGRLVQASIKFQLLTQLGKELEEYVKKGKIKEDYFSTDRDKSALSELLKFIDEEAPDEERFRAMKSLFLTSISKATPASDQALAYELMQICKKLTAGEILVLKAAFDIVNGRLDQSMPSVDHSTTNANDWLNIISHQLGHVIPSLVEVHEKNLIGLKLISDRTHSDRSGVGRTQHFRLTTLGYKLCEFITKYE